MMLPPICSTIFGTSLRTNIFIARNIPPYTNRFPKYRHRSLAVRTRWSIVSRASVLFSIGTRTTNERQIHHSTTSFSKSVPMATTPYYITIDERNEIYHTNLAAPQLLPESFWKQNFYYRRFFSYLYRKIWQKFHSV